MTLDAVRLIRWPSALYVYGDQTLKMEVASFPIDPDAMKAQIALSTALAAALVGQGALTVAIKPNEPKPA